MLLPVVKLGSLVLRTLSKPIASRLKQQTGNYPKFREYIIGLAQANHRFTTTIQRRLYGQATDVKIRPLNEEKAVQAAADLIGELFVFSVAGAAIIFEVQRSARSEARKEESRRQELEAMKQKEQEVAKELELLKVKLDELEHLARGRGLLSIFGVTHGQESLKSVNPTLAA
ncbi:OPA3-like protein isoform X1 [Musa acuminata AAA Group]|uniref:OPA3-like protein isoform X1 n=1 Tax=Musa acuminata AAA Group TaxID=214697 RepID=UPI0031D91E6F